MAKITVFGFLKICLSLSCQVITAVVHVVEQFGNLISIQTDDRLLMEFRHIYEESRVFRDRLSFIEISVETSKCGHFTGKSFFRVRDLLIVLIS